MKLSTAVFASIVAICCTVISTLWVSPSNAASTELPPIIQVGVKIDMMPIDGPFGGGRGWKTIHISGVNGEWVETKELRNGEVGRPIWRHTSQWNWSK